MSCGMHSVPTWRRTRRRSRGQSLVEFSILLPLLLFFLAGSYTVWQAVHQDIALTNAARAGAITAVTSLNATIKAGGGHIAGVPTKADLCTALKAAQSGVAEEENVPTSSVALSDPPGPNHVCTGPPKTCASAGSNICVGMTYVQRSLFTFNEYYYVAQIVLTQQLTSQVPMMNGVHVTATATDSTI